MSDSQLDFTIAKLGECRYVSPMTGERFTGDQTGFIDATSGDESQAVVKQSNGRKRVGPSCAALGLCLVEQREAVARTAEQTIDQTQAPEDGIEKIAVEVVPTQCPRALERSRGSLQISRAGLELAEADVSMETQRPQAIAAGFAFPKMVLREASTRVEFSKLRQTHHHPVAD